MFEVGSSETHSALIDDAEHWFIRTKKSVQLVILININEDQTALARRKATPEYQNQVENLARQFANEAALSDMAIEDEDAERNVRFVERRAGNRQLYIYIYIYIVGPIEAFLEVVIRI